MQKRNGERKATGETAHARKGQTRLRQVNFARNIEIHVRHRRYGMASVLPWWWWLVVVGAAVAELCSYFTLFSIRYDVQLPADAPDGSILYQ